MQNIPLSDLTLGSKGNASLIEDVSFASKIFHLRGLYGLPPALSDGWCPVNKGNSHLMQTLHFYV